MPRIGIPELFLMSVILLTSLAPIVVTIWVIVMLQRIKAGQEVIRRRLTAIEGILQRNS